MSDTKALLSEGDVLPSVADERSHLSAHSAPIHRSTYGAASPTGGSVTFKNGKHSNSGMDTVSIDGHSRLSSVIAKSDRLTLTWSGVNVYAAMKSKSRFKRASNNNVESQTGKKHILRDVYGVAAPGQLLAIMGSSGAGKTTMLNVLTRRNLGELEVSGCIRINGEEVTKRQLRLCSAYVQQDDLFMSTLTVTEHLMFNAMLRMGRHSTAEQRRQRVHDVISELNLTKCAHTLIGDPLRSRGISGGERKRLAFASELLTNPSLMFCDEPTSGLDSFMAYNVISVLKKEAAKGKTIVCTIHQPSSQVFALFDQVYLMAEGRVAFAGSAKQATAFFDAIGHPSPGNFNPADHYIRVLAVVPRKERECRRRIKEVCVSYAQSEHGRRMAAKAQADVTNLQSDGASSIAQRYPENEAYMHTLKYRATWCQQFGALLKRAALDTVREPLLLRVRTFQIIVRKKSPLPARSHALQLIAILTGLIYIVVNMTFSFVFAVVNTFCDELPIFLREHFSGLYRVDTYFFSKIIADTPLYMILPFVFTTIVYWMAGLYADLGVYLINVIIAVLTANVAISIGYAISCATANVNIALSLTPVIIIPLMLFGGFYLNNASVPVYFIWLQYLSYFKYSFEAVAVNQWTHVPKIPGCSSMLDTVANSTVSTARNATEACASTGEQVLGTLAFNPNSLVLNIVILLVMIVGIRGIALGALLLRTALKR